MDESRWNGWWYRVFARYYDRITEAAERGWLASVRQRLVADLTGEVLEIGAGTGANLRYYQKADRLVATEPAPAMRSKLTARAAGAAVPVEVRPAAAEELPFPDGSFDAAVCTLVLCSVEEVDRTAAEIRRVLRPGGRLVFIEHVRDTGIRGRIQDGIDPLWRRVAAGCHANRNTESALQRAGFQRVWSEQRRPRPNSPLTAPVVYGEMRAADR